jgi:TolB-like protein
VNSHGVKRKLTAILSADVKGYSRLMGEDELDTVRTITLYRNVMSDLIQRQNGRVVDSPGDNLLAEFSSVVDAVACAEKIQKDLRDRNSDLPDNRRMEFRIGVNLGDVIEEEGRIYGEGVNIAARIESLAEGGGISISRNVYEQVKKKLNLKYAYQGEHTVKNITEPVQVYRIEIEDKVDFEERKSEVKVPEKPSIAVLPFSNMSGDPEQEYFSDGITEDIITDLSKISGLFVIARNSTFTYKGKPVKVDKVGQDLGVRYVLEGSVRKAGDRVRITAQLIDANTDGHLWAERYDRDLNDIFALQDEVTQKIVTALELKLTEDEHERLVHKETDNLEAYDFVLRGAEYLIPTTEESNAKAQRMFEKAIEIDPGYALAYSCLGRSIWIGWTLGWNQDPALLDRSGELAKKAIALDESHPFGHSLLGDVYLWKKQHERAIAELEQAITLNPNDADGLSTLGGVLSWAGRERETIALVEKAMRLNPVYPVWYVWNLGHAFFMMGQYEEAIMQLKRALIRTPNYPPAHAYLTLSYIELGREEEARAEAKAFKRLSPETPLEAWRHRLPYKDEKILERALEGFRKAGLE